jgi:DNA-binding Lrp family transcriptional regulator
MTNIVLHLSETAPITINALAKATELSPTQLTLELVELGGRVIVKDGGIVLAPPVVKEVKVRKSNGPRGQMAKVVARLEAARTALLGLVGAGPTTVNAVLIAVGDAAKYGDILFVAREEMAKGTIVETKQGRKNVWALAEAAE